MANRRPAYYNDIDDRFNKLEDRQREFRESIDHIQVNQSEQMNRIKEIHHLLAGTEYEKNNGGLVGDIKRLKVKVSKNTSWRIKITAAGTAIVSVISFVLVKFGSIINTIKELIKTD